MSEEIKRSHPLEETNEEKLPEASWAKNLSLQATVWGTNN